MTNEEAYRQGFIDGLRCFAHWKDGKEFVGTSGTPYKEAIMTVEKRWNYNPPKEGGGNRE